MFCNVNNVVNSYKKVVLKILYNKLFLHLQILNLDAKTMIIILRVLLSIINDGETADVDDFVTLAASV